MQGGCCLVPHNASFGLLIINVSHLFLGDLGHNLSPGIKFQKNMEHKIPISCAQPVKVVQEIQAPIQQKKRALPALKLCYSWYISLCV